MAGGERDAGRFDDDCADVGARTQARQNSNEFADRFA